MQDSFWQLKSVSHYPIGTVKLTIPLYIKVSALKISYLSLQKSMPDTFLHKVATPRTSGHQTRRTTAQSTGKTIKNSVIKDLWSNK